MAVRISAELQTAVVLRARSRCEYCRLDEWLSGIPCEIDHVVPVAVDGETALDNLALACSPCNRHKAKRTQATDPVSGKVVPLYHPRQHLWREHFAWSDDGTQIVGLTEIGRGDR
jgi:hypothetical protein